MRISPIKTRIFREGENLLEFIKEHIPKAREGSILVVTSKIVAFSERRTASKKHKKKEELIRKESDLAVKTKLVWLTVKDGMFMTSAGIDESNARGKYVLLPKDSYASALFLHRKLRSLYRLKKLGVLITDSRCLPLRAGAIGFALGYAGFKGIRDYRGKPDIFGRTMTMSRGDIADGLAAAAVLAMGEGDERQPLAIIENAPVEFTDKVNRKELFIPFEEDMYRPLFGGKVRKPQI